MKSPPPNSTHFPYTTLFRSGFLSRIAPAHASGPRCSWAGTRNSRGGASQGAAVSNRLRECARSAAFSIETRSAKANRSEEHTSELQSRLHLVCRLLLEKKKQ